MPRLFGFTNLVLTLLNVLYMTTGGGGRGGLLDGIKGKDSFVLSRPICKRVGPSLTRL
jgi:hypothetical protein